MKPIPLVELCTDGGGFMQYVLTHETHNYRNKEGKPWTEENEPTDTLHHVDTLAEAHGIWFDCPLCYTKNGGPIKTHGILIWFAGKPVPDHMGKNADGQTVRWNIVAGTGLSDLQISPSIHLKGSSCGWHGWIGSSGVPPGHAA